MAGPIRFTAGGDNTGCWRACSAEFLARHPKVQLDVVLTPRRVDLVAEGFDLALRAGATRRLVAGRAPLGRIELGLFASAGLPAQGGPAHRPSELARHRCVLFGEPATRGACA